MNCQLSDKSIHCIYVATINSAIEQIYTNNYIRNNYYDNNYIKSSYECVRISYTYSI